MRATMALVLLIVILGAAPALRAEGSDNDFTFVNATGYTIDSLFVSAADKNSWENDILGKDKLADGESVHIKFHESEGADKYDIKVIYDDKTEAIWQDVDLTKVDSFTAHYNRKEDKTWADVK